MVIKRPRDIKVKDSEIKEMAEVKVHNQRTEANQDWAEIQTKSWELNISLGVSCKCTDQTLAKFKLFDSSHCNCQMVQGCSGQLILN